MRRYLSLVALLAVTATVLAACGGGAGTPGSDRLQVVTTIYPLDYMTGRIAGNEADVQLLIGTGAEAHTFEPTASDIQRIASAQLVVANGLDLEPWLDRAIGGLSERPLVVEASDIEGLEAHDDEEHEDHEVDEHEGEGHEGEEHHDEHDHETDPHVWLDPVLAQRQAERIRDALSEADPDAAAGYAERAQALIDELAAVHDEYVAGLASCLHDDFVTTHAAYGYLAERYGLHQISITGISPEAEPTPGELAELTSLVASLDLSYVLVEPSVSPRLAETVAAESDLELLPIHQMESVTEAELTEHGDYIGLLRANLSSLRTALECA